MDLIWMKSDFNIRGLSLRMQLGKKEHKGCYERNFNICYF